MVSKAVPASSTASSSPPETEGSFEVSSLRESASAIAEDHNVADGEGVEGDGKPAADAEATATVDDDSVPQPPQPGSNRAPPPPPPPRKAISSQEAEPIDSYVANLKSSSSNSLGSLSIDNTERPKFKLPFDPEKRFRKLHKEIIKKSVLWEPALKAFLDDD